MHVSFPHITRLGRLHSLGSFQIASEMGFSFGKHLSSGWLESPSQLCCTPGRISGSMQAHSPGTHVYLNRSKVSSEAAEAICESGEGGNHRSLSVSMHRQRIASL